MNYKFLIFNIKSTSNSLILKIILLSSVFFLLSSHFAFTANPKNTITVLPQLTQVDLSHDLPETQIFYTNNSSSPVELALSVQDVRELEDRNPVGILDPKEAANYKYSLSSWVFLDKQTLLLNPGETKPITVTITKDKLSPGGHYGSVLAEMKTTDTNKKTVKIKGVLASLLFVRASTGSEIEEAKIAFFGPSDQGLSLPTTFIFRFQNTGNVDLTPYGVLTIKDGREKTIASGVVNEDSLITLPESIRKYTITTKPIHTTILPGKYTATLSLHFGKGRKTLTSSTTFLTLGSTDTIKWEIVIIALVFALGIGNIILKRKLKNTLNS